MMIKVMHYYLYKLTSVIENNRHSAVYIQRDNV